jgi:hypothetical protein
MQNVFFRLMVHGKSYDEVVDTLETKLSNFTKTPKEDIKTKFNIDYNFYMSNDDGVTDPTYSAEVVARMRNYGQK